LSYRTQEEIFRLQWEEVCKRLPKNGLGFCMTESHLFGVVGNLILVDASDDIHGDEEEAFAKEKIDNIIHEIFGHNFQIKFINFIVDIKNKFFTTLEAFRADIENLAQSGLIEDKEISYWDKTLNELDGKGKLKIVDDADVELSDSAEETQREDIWNQVIEAVAIPFVRMSLKNGYLISADDDAFYVIFSSNFHYQKVTAGTGKSAIEAAIKKVFGYSSKLQTYLVPKECWERLQGRYYALIDDFKADLSADHSGIY